MKGGQREKAERNEGCRGMYGREESERKGRERRGKELPVVGDGGNASE